MNKPRVNARLLPNMDTAEVGIISESGQRVGVEMTVEQVELMIAALADIRSKMNPPVPENCPQGKPTHKHDATKYFLGIDAITLQPSLFFRSPGFGWLSFSLPYAEADKLGRHLLTAKEQAAKVKIHIQN
jgi:hypothetical protein